MSTLLTPNHDAMTLPQPRNPLHGITLEQLLIALVERIGWEATDAAVPIRCFTHDPTVTVSTSPTNTNPDRSRGRDYWACAGLNDRSRRTPAPNRSRELYTGLLPVSWTFC